MTINRRTLVSGAPVAAACSALPFVLMLGRKAAAAPSASEAANVVRLRLHNITAISNIIARRKPSARLQELLAEMMARESRALSRDLEHILKTLV